MCIANKFDVIDMKTTVNGIVFAETKKFKGLACVYKEMLFFGKETKRRRSTLINSDVPYFKR